MQNRPLCKKGACCSRQSRRRPLRWLQSRQVQRRLLLKRQSRSLYTPHAATSTSSALSFSCFCDAFSSARLSSQVCACSFMLILMLPP